MRELSTIIEQQGAIIAGQIVQWSCCFTGNNECRKGREQEKRKEEKKQSGAEKEAKKAKRIEDEAERCANIFPGLTADADRGYEYVKTLKNDCLTEIVRFYFFESLAGRGNKDKLLGKLDHFMANFDNVNAEMVSNEGNGDIQVIKIQIHIDNYFIWLSYSQYTSSQCLNFTVGLLTIQRSLSTLCTLSR